ncbi:SDR family NAD(P)-dependent oxidoreductase [Rouxiella chamberiensis]|nr:SDR family NAD(P)-dependent oxidoreductase [Rouxiella chamberiensis]
MTDESKIILITGSTDGVGRKVAERLAVSGNKILIHGRNHQRGEDVVQFIRNQGGDATFYHADFSSLDGVRQLAAEVRQEHSKLDVLINNAGIGVSGNWPGRTESVDGFELRFAVNYLASFLLTRLLLPALFSAENARIVNVSSAGQQEIDFENIMLTHHYSGERAYCQSKLALILFTCDLALELGNSNIAVNALHPATYMNTSMVKNDGMPALSSVEEGADAILQLAISSSTEGQTGLYFDRFLPGHPHRQAFDMGARTALRATSFVLTNLQDPMQQQG